MDNGTFRLVPNDYEVEGREGRVGDTVPDIQGTLLFYKVTKFNESRSKERAGRVKVMRGGRVCLQLTRFVFIIKTNSNVKCEKPGKEGNKKGWEGERGGACIKGRGSRELLTGGRGKGVCNGSCGE